MTSESDPDRSDQVVLDVIGVRVEVTTNAPMVLLQESGGGRCLPIWIGAAEAASIVNALEGVVSPRPHTHDLLAEVLAQLAQGPAQGQITQMHDGTFDAELIVDGHHIDARPSDVIALALRAGFPVTAPLALLDEVGIAPEPEPEDEVERFRHFLDQVTPDDFDE